MIPVEAKGLLKDIHSPEDLRKLDRKKLEAFCGDLRTFLIENGSENGGHFAASLGVVEITTALHYVYQTPYDKIVWDVGHQAYGHKVLTGRRDQFHTNRLYQGVSPFPKRKESEFDTFGVGHSATSISSALGMAMAAKLNGDEERQHVAVIGDGSLTGGLAFEGLNHGGSTDANLTVILNDNCMSIDPNVGALKEYLTDITVSGYYNKMRDEIWELLGHFKSVGASARDLASRVEKNLKGFVSKQSNFFESLGFRYFGPIDGHDVDHLVKVLEEFKKIPGPKLLHCVTQKGKGYHHAEQDPLKWHAPGKFDVASGKIHKSSSAKPQPPKYQDVFGHTILELAKENEQIMGITPAMPSGSSLKIMMDEMPKRALDVGIAEQHAVTFSAGLATEGKKVFCNIYSSFMQRAYDSVIHDVAIQELPVVFCLDRAGIAGADGATHHGAFDIAFMRCIPNMIVFAPMNEHELRNIMYTAQLEDHLPMVIRYPRGQGVLSDWKNEFTKIEIGTGRWIEQGEKICVVSLGHVGNYVTKVLAELQEEEGLQLGHFDLRFVKPLDKENLRKIATEYDQVLTVEDGCIQGGMASAILEFFAEESICTPVKSLGIPDQFIEHGTQGELHEECGYSPSKIKSTLKELLNLN